MRGSREDPLDPVDLRDHKGLHQRLPRGDHHHGNPIQTLSMALQMQAYQILRRAIHGPKEEKERARVSQRLCPRHHQQMCRPISNTGRQCHLS